MVIWEYSDLFAPSAHSTHQLFNAEKSPNFFNYLPQLSKVLLLYTLYSKNLDID